LIDNKDTVKEDLSMNSPNVNENFASDEGLVAGHFKSSDFIDEEKNEEKKLALKQQAMMASL